MVWLIFFFFASSLNLCIVDFFSTDIFRYFFARVQIQIFFIVLLIFHCLPSSTWTALPLCLQSSLCWYEVTLNIIVFGQWQGSSGLSEYYVSSWIIPTEFHRCLVMCRWAWLGCMAGISLPIAVGDIVSVHTKALLHMLSIHLSVRYFYSTLFHERTLSWTLALRPGLLPEVWSSLFPLFLNSYVYYCWFFNVCNSDLSSCELFPNIVPVCSASTY